MKIVKLLILDVDGVLSDGKKYYADDGFALYKTFCDKDFTAIKKFKASNCEVVFLSGDDRVNKNLAKNRNIDFYYSRGKCKTEFIENILKKYNVTINETAFVGDDIFDLPLMKQVQFKYCPNDAARELKEICVTLQNNGGDNCINELYNVLLDNNYIKPYDIKTLLDIDSNDKF
jgi:3-deoxy-D-manno-octulosonate 8-phosphate phosphatase (KDO 8-P phosphatase)